LPETRRDYLAAIDGRHGADPQFLKESVMISKFFLASIVAVAAFAAVPPAHAGGPGGSGGQNGVSANGLQLNGIDPNGIDPNGIDPNGIDPNGIDPNGTKLVGANTGSLDSEDSHVSTQPQPLFSIDGAIVPQ
jgi:hypothetical protein